MRLDQRTGEAGDTDRPYYTLRELLPGTVNRWLKLSPERDVKVATADLATMPGLLRLLPKQLGFEAAPFAQFMAALLLETDAVPTPAGPWSEVLRKVALAGPGERATRLELLQLLSSRGYVPAGETLPFTGTVGGVKTLQLELHSDPEGSSLPEATRVQVETAIVALHEGRYGEARTLLEPLADTRPDAPSLRYNLALSEWLDPSLEVGEARGRERLETLIREHPEYLFAKAFLASQALGRGDVAGAKAWLTWPENLERLHVQAYAVFTAVLGQLALAEGDIEQAVELLEELADVVGEENAAFLSLVEAVAAWDDELWA